MVISLAAIRLQTMDAQNIRRGAGENRIKSLALAVMPEEDDKEVHRKQKKVKASERKNQQRLQEHPPGVVHLMSFPNSGTTYTLTAIQKTTRQCTASHQYHPKSAPGMVLPNSSNIGPYYECEIDSWLPDNYVLSKSHCKSFCTLCFTYDVAQKLSQEKFQEHCHESKKVSYDLTTVKKNVHLVRNPFDNVVARFHNNFKQSYEERFTGIYEKTYEGFHQYCAWHNEEFSTKHSSIFLSANHKELALKVPCLGEFYKYIAWHNLANMTIEKMGVPSLTIHYEDYHENFHETFSALISFLETKQEIEPLPFFWHDYPEYFDEDARNAATILMKSWASNETRALIDRYLDSNLMSDAS
jgi:hypothetical protein